MFIHNSRIYLAVQTVELNYHGDKDIILLATNCYNVRNSGLNPIMIQVLYFSYRLAINCKLIKSLKYEG